MKRLDKNLNCLFKKYTFFERHIFNLLFVIK